MPFSLYFHIPFCTHRCAYCDFNTYAGQESLIPAYVDALIREIEFVGGQLQIQASNYKTIELPNYPTTVHTVFFGGGTPSLLSSAQFESIFRAIRDNFDLLENSEITIEANPGTVSYEELKKLRKIGINRISFGVQSANSEELKMLERAHNFLDVIEAVASARKAGFDNLNLDLIYGLPEQTLQTWQTTVKRILDLHPEHISAYALTLEHGTPFGRWSSRGLMPTPDPDLAADMYEWASDIFESAGYIQYEISNWAKNFGSSGAGGRDAFQPPSYACKHNLQYWRSLPYLAFGAGAHGYANGFRYSNALRIKTYIERLTTNNLSLVPEFPLSPATANHHRQTEQDDISEFMLNGLRLTNAGIMEPDFRSRFGRGLLDVYRREIEELILLGLLEWKEDSPLPLGAPQGCSPALQRTQCGRLAPLGSRPERGASVAKGLGVRVKILRLTKRGRLLGNQVFMRFVQ
jgi:putative oxygen-independent coproporphyrinogen III oxidase